MARSIPFGRERGQPRFTMLTWLT